MADQPEQPAGPRMVQCQKLGRELEGLQRRPFKNELGERIYQHISRQAWDMWVEHSKMLVNEFRLDLMAPEARDFLLKEAEKFFFGEGGEAPPDYVPPSEHED